MATAPMTNSIIPPSSRLTNFLPPIQHAYLPDSSTSMAHHLNNSLRLYNWRKDQALSVNFKNIMPRNIDQSILAQNSTYSYPNPAYAQAPSVKHYMHYSTPPPASRVQPPHSDWLHPGQHGGHVTPGFPVNANATPVPPQQSNKPKRPRRRFGEIERLYKCSWEGCCKAYGTLNHLNTHVKLQGHGMRRSPNEFGDTRNEWKQKRREEQPRGKAEENEQDLIASSQWPEATAPPVTAPSTCGYLGGDRTQSAHAPIDYKPTYQLAPLSSRNLYLFSGHIPQIQ